MHIYLGLIRLPHVRSFSRCCTLAISTLLTPVRITQTQVGTDILVTLNHPVAVQPTSSVGDVSNSIRPSDEAMAVFRDILRSFAILDWSLFAA